MDFNVFRCQECQRVMPGANIPDHIRETHHQKFVIAGSDSPEPSREFNSSALERALVLSCLDAFGKSTKDTLLFYLKEKYGIAPGSNDFTLKQLETALVDLLGEQGASVLIGMIHTKLDDLTSLSRSH